MGVLGTSNPAVARYPSEWIVRGLVSAVFVAAGLAKLAEPMALVDTIAFFLGPRLSVDAALFVLALLAAFESVTGAAMVLYPRSRVPPLTVAVASVVFSVLRLRLATADDPPSCGCLGGLIRAENARVEARAGLVRNAGLLICVAWLILRINKRSGTADETGGKGAS